MSLDLHLEILDIALEHTSDHSTDCIEDVIQLLVEHGFNAEEIADATTNDEVKHVLQDYTEEVEVDDKEDEYEDEYDWDE